MSSVSLSLDDLDAGLRPELLWTAAIVLFGIGDLVTTWWFLQHGHVEANPLMAAVLERYGFGGMVVSKFVGVAVLGLLYGGVNALPAPYSKARVAVPATMAFMGAIAVVHNLRVVYG